ncbi:MAG TPA: hypothetical protein VH370_07885 [Humisphaera sp.]|jgi:hypothetical protein|nr:hypothetical protein [Humisphaera sp.]
MGLISTRVRIRAGLASGASCRHVTGDAVALPIEKIGIDPGSSVLIYMYARRGSQKFFNAMGTLGVCFILLPHHDLRDGSPGGRRKSLEIFEFLFFEVIFEIFRKL